ncbi:MAG: hypothetical protein NVV72_04320 [Asticcacaulis sp.]|nr:hypothetical protein [Asticcacaulis sp.]
MVAMIAVVRKLLTQINAMIRDNSPWTEQKLGQQRSRSPTSRGRTKKPASCETGFCENRDNGATATVTIPG